MKRPTWNAILATLACAALATGAGADEQNRMTVSFNEKNKRLGWRWARGLILNLSIGQGQLVTPLQQEIGRAHV